MSDISRPFVTEDDPDRPIRCQDALQLAFRELVDHAVDSGWKEAEVLAGLRELAEHQSLALTSSERTEALLRALKQLI
ncbi:hypothetical protein [Rhizobium sp. 21-4511-3d]